MIKNYIFDFGNVLAKFCPKELTECVVKDPESAKIITDVIFNATHWEKLDEGLVTDDIVKQRITSSLSDGLSLLGVEVFDKWIENLPPMWETVEVVEKLKKSGKKLYILSNISKGFANSYHNYPWIKELFDKFDGLVFSGEVGMIKPDKRIFEHILEKYGLNAKECLFIDDSKANTDAASALGINTYLFDGDANKLEEFINKKSECR